MEEGEELNAPWRQPCSRLCCSPPLAPTEGYALERAEMHGAQSTGEIRIFHFIRGYGHLREGKKFTCETEASHQRQAPMLKRQPVLSNDCWAVQGSCGVQEWPWVSSVDSYGGPDRD